MVKKFSAAQGAASAAQDSLNAAAKDAAIAAKEAAEQLKNTVKDYFPTGKTKEKEKEHHHLFGEKKEKHHLFGDKKEKHHLFGGKKEKHHHEKHHDKHHEKHHDKHHDKQHGLFGFNFNYPSLFGFNQHKDQHQHQHHVTDILPDKTHVLTFFAMPYMAIMIALIVVLLSALMFMRRRNIMSKGPVKKLMQWMRQKRMHKSTVLICGPADAGKTLLFHTLSGAQFQPTQTSMEENINTFKINDKLLTESKKDKLKDINFEFIDFPGHPSQEMKLGKFMSNLQGVILLVDASSSDSINNGAKTLYTLMEKKGFLGKKAPVLVCANKIDLDMSQPMNTVRQKILDEINKMRDNRPSMENTEKREEDITSIGKSGERLTWDNLGLTVSFGQISAKQGNVTDVLDFLEGIQCC